MSVTRTIELVDLTPAELAELFCAKFDDEQAEFFAEVSKIASTWPGAGWCQQACSIASKLGREGSEVVTTLAGHIELAKTGGDQS